MHLTGWGGRIQGRPLHPRNSEISASDSGVILDTLARAGLRIVQLGWFRGVECRDEYAGPIEFFSGMACQLRKWWVGLLESRRFPLPSLQENGGWSYTKTQSGDLYSIILRIRIIHPKCVICVHILFISQVCIYNALVWGPYFSSIRKFQSQKNLDP